MASTSTDRLLGIMTSVAIKAPVKAVSSTTLTLSGLQTVGGVALAEGDRVLVRNQSDGTENGIYDASTSGWTRSADFDGNRDVVKGTLVPHGESSGIFYRLTSADPVVIGTSSITFEAITLVLVKSDLNTLISQHPAGTNAILGPGAYDDSGMSGTIGYRCTAFGVDTLKQNSSSTVAGGSNTAMGYGSQRDSVDTSGNTSVGTFTLAACTGVASAHNGAFGNSTLEALVSGTQNNAFAYRCMYQLTSGNNNTGMGDVCLQGLLVGSGNTNYGYQSGHSKIGGDYTHAYGYQALFNEQAALITGITKAASAVVTISTVSSINPFSVGQPVVIENAGGMTEINGVTTGLVSAIGGSSGAWTVTISINSSGFTTYTTGGYLAPLGNTVFGYRAGYNVSMRGGCTLIGFDVAQTGEPGYGSTIIGHQAGLVVNCNIGGSGGELNTLVGYWAARALTSGAVNVVIGQRSASALTTGSDHVIIGSNAGSGVSTALRNVCIGSVSGINLNGNNNTSVGYNAGSQGSAQTYTNCGSFGANAVPTASNQITLGDSGIATLRCQQTSITALSDERFKTDIRPLDIPDGAMEELQLFIFSWLLEGMPKGPQVGVIAQRLDAWAEKWGLQWMGLVDKSNPDRWEATPHKLLFLLIVAHQKLAARVTALESKAA